MKIKLDYITNSSSASFYLYFTYKNDDLVEFKESLNSIFKSVIDEDPDVIIRFYNPREVVNRLSKNVFYIIDGTSMFNDSTSIPKYMQRILVNSFIPEYLKKFGISKIEFEIKHD